MFLSFIHWSFVFSFKLIFRLDLAGFYHSRANRIGRLWIFEIVPLLDYRLYSQESHIQYTGEFFESNKTLRTLLSFKSFMRVFVTSLGELKEIVL